MTTEEIQQHVDAAITANFANLTTESGELTTSKGGDGRFVGKVVATRYSGLPARQDFFLAIGQTDQQAQIVKLGKTECLTPSRTDLNLMLTKELGLDPE